MIKEKSIENDNENFRLKDFIKLDKNFGTNFGVKICLS